MCAGVWVFGRSIPLPLWLIAVVIAAGFWRWPFALEPVPASARIGLRDIAVTILISAPSIVNLIGTWRGEFPTSGDQFVHNSYDIEAFELWWPWLWIAGVVAIAAVARNATSLAPLVGFAAVAILAMFDIRGGFVVRYPALLHFFTVPFRALMPARYPIDIERLVNIAAIPVWLLVLRPRLLGRRVDLFAITAGTLLFWQKDVVYYMTSAYLEPWAFVLMLTAAEALMRGVPMWIALTLIGTAALFKDQMIIALPVAALLFFSRRNAILATIAMMPFALWALRAGSNVLRGAGLAAVPLDHASKWIQRVTVQFQSVLPVIALAVVTLIVLAFRNRGALALLIAAIADAAIFFFSPMQREWPGYPRVTLVPLAFVAVALAFALERFGRKALIAAAAIVVLNIIPLAPFLGTAFATSDERNFFEHRDAPIFYPVREILDHQHIVPMGGRVDILYNARHIRGVNFPVLMQDAYPDLAARYRLQVKSFASMDQRCRCTSGVANLAVFIRFAGLGAARPERAAIEAEAAQCRSILAATCHRQITVQHNGAIVGVLAAQ